VRRPARGLGLPGLLIACVLAATACTSTQRATRPTRPVETPAVDRRERPVRVLRGKAVWYGGKWHGRRTASGERFDKRKLTAAHRTLPLGTRIRVVNLDNERSVILKVNDRGPYGRDRSRIIDVSEAAARRLGFRDRGWTRVRIEVLPDRPTRSARDAPPGRRR
jgi:rare lipoprotein A